MTVGSNLLQFSYDAAGTPMAVLYNGTTYYYVTNIQGDVIAILDATGAAVVEYTYDAWGNPISTTGSMASTLGETNPLRYRSYTYDAEYELYYLQSRYYNPNLGRFVNADAFTATGQGLLGNDMFAYCLNNPVAFFDPSGLCTYIGYQPWLSPNGQYIDCGQIKCPQSSNYKGNYFKHDVDDISHTTKKKHKIVSEEDAVDYYNKIAAGDYSATSGSSSAIAGSVVPPLISILIGLFSDLAGASNNRITDPQGRILYIEEGYTVETIERQYWDMDYCASDIEYFIYDQDDNLVFNDVIGLTYLPDEHG